MDIATPTVAMGRGRLLGYACACDVVTLGTGRNYCHGDMHFK